MTHHFIIWDCSHIIPKLLAEVLTLEIKPQCAALVKLSESIVVCSANGLLTCFLTFIVRHSQTQNHKPEADGKVIPRSAAHNYVLNGMM